MRYGRVNFAGSCAAGAAAFVEFFRPKKFILCGEQSKQVEPMNIGYTTPFLLLSSVVIVNLACYELAAVALNSPMYPSAHPHAAPHSTERSTKYNTAREQKERAQNSNLAGSAEDGR